MKRSETRGDCVVAATYEKGEEWTTDEEEEEEEDDDEDDDANSIQITIQINYLITRPSQRINH